MSSRGIAEFSQRDRVRLRALGDGARFLWRGARWLKGPDAIYRREGLLTFHEKALSPAHSISQPHTRVVVSRASGDAMRARDASRAQEGDR
jgi:hypothetical protein